MPSCEPSCRPSSGSSAEADAARISAENAEAGCRDAREELAACEEAEARASEVPPASPDEPHPFDERLAGEPPSDLSDPGCEALARRRCWPGCPLIVRILRGDREARERLVAILAAGDPDAERDWGLRVSRLVDAIVGRAIEDGYLDVPDDHPFWRLFEHGEARDIVGALSALGFRFDGLGGFADGRVPAARDLSLAVGYAGLDRMRIRTWPRESELAGAVRGRGRGRPDEWLADQADDLSLGRMVDALGGRAAELADVWNAWGRVRPALLVRPEPGGGSARRPGRRPRSAGASRASGPCSSSASSSITMTRNASAAAPPIALALLGGPLADAGLEPLGVADLARVGSQRVELAARGSR